MSVAQLGLAAFAIALPLGALATALPIAVQFRRLGRFRPPELPATPEDRLVLPCTRIGRGLILLSALGSLLLLVAIVDSFLAARLFAPAPAVAILATLALVLLRSYADGRAAGRLELGSDGFTLGQRRGARKVRWLHLTELRADGDVIRYRVNRALVSGSSWRYWDGTIRNGWGVDTGRLLRLLERYRERALDTAPHFLTGRPERSH